MIVFIIFFSIFLQGQIKVITGWDFSNLPFDGTEFFNNSKQTTELNWPYVVADFLNIVKYLDKGDLETFTTINVDKIKNFCPDPDDCGNLNTIRKVLFDIQINFEGDEVFGDEKLNFFEADNSDGTYDLTYLRDLLVTSGPALAFYDTNHLKWHYEDDVNRGELVVVYGFYAYNGKSYWKIKRGENKDMEGFLEIPMVKDGTDGGLTRTFIFLNNRLSTLSPRQPAIEMLLMPQPKITTEMIWDDLNQFNLNHYERSDYEAEILSPNNIKNEEYFYITSKGADTSDCRRLGSACASLQGVFTKAVATKPSLSSEGLLTNGDALDRIVYADIGALKVGTGELKIGAGTEGGIRKVNVIGRGAGSELAYESDDANTDAGIQPKAVVLYITNITFSLSGSSGLSRLITVNHVDATLRMQQVDFTYTDNYLGSLLSIGTGTAVLDLCVFKKITYTRSLFLINFSLTTIPHIFVIQHSTFTHLTSNFRTDTDSPLYYPIFYEELQSDDARPVDASARTAQRAARPVFAVSATRFVTITATAPSAMVVGAVFAFRHKQWGRALDVSECVFLNVRATNFSAPVSFHLSTHEYMFEVPRLGHNTFENCEGDLAGAIYSNEGHFYVVDSRFINNTHPVVPSSTGNDITVVPAADTYLLSRAHFANSLTDATDAHVKPINRGSLQLLHLDTNAGTGCGPITDQKACFSYLDGRTCGYVSGACVTYNAYVQSTCATHGYASGLSPCMAALGGSCCFSWDALDDLYADSSFDPQHTGLILDARLCIPLPTEGCRDRACSSKMESNCSAAYGGGECHWDGACVDGQKPYEIYIPPKPTEKKSYTVVIVVIVVSVVVVLVAVGAIIFIIYYRKKNKMKNLVDQLMTTPGIGGEGTIDFSDGANFGTIDFGGESFADDNPPADGAAAGAEIDPFASNDIAGESTEKMGGDESFPAGSSGEEGGGGEEDKGGTAAATSTNFEPSENISDITENISDDGGIQ